MKWESTEDRISVLVFLKNHVYNAARLSASIQEASDLGVDKAEGSIKMKFSNIAALCDEYKIEVKSKVPRLSNYSLQCHEEFLEAKNFSLLEIFNELSKIRKGDVD